MEAEPPSEAAARPAAKVNPKKRRKYKSAKLTSRANKSRKNTNQIRKIYRPVVEEKKDDDDSDASFIPDEERKPAAAEDTVENQDDQQVQLQVIAKGTDKRGRKVFSYEQRRARRMGIYYFFSQVFGSPPEDSGDWYGKKGVGAQIRDMMCLPKGAGTLRAIYKTFRVIKEYEKNKKQYIGKPNPRKEWAHYLIGTGSFEAKLIAQLTEAGNGFTAITKRVNQYRVNQLGVIHVGRSCVYQTQKRLKPLVTKIQKRQQGSLNLESEWCRASHRWSLQMCLVLGELKEDSVPKKFYIMEDKVLVIPKCFTIKELPMRDLKACTIWDETHKDQQSGTIRKGTSIEYRYPWNDDGELDLENGTYKEEGTELKMKYREQARFSLGMCLLIDENGNIVKDSKGRPLGVMLEIFEYTMQKIVSHSDWLREWRRVIKEPKSYEAKKPWVTTDRDQDKYYKGDPVITLPGIGKAAVAWLKERNVPSHPNGVNTVGEYYTFFYGKQKRRKAFVKAINGMNDEKQLVAEREAETALPGLPNEVDHRKHPHNPWLSLYGQEWNDYVLKHKDMKKIRDVRDLVKHIDRCTLEQYKGTVYEGKECYIHDALSLMTSKENTDWMRREDMLKRWILPEHDLNVMFKSYKNPRPVGNHAGGNSWDQTCNKDTDDIMMTHVAATSHLPKTDERKFSMASPATISYGFRRIFNNPPVLRNEEPILPAGECGLPGYRMGHDICELPNYWRKVFLNEGLNTQRNVRGHRGNEVRDAAKNGKIKKTRGGKRVKMTQEEAMQLDWMHPDAQSAYDEFFKDSYSKWLEALEETRKKHEKGFTDPKEPAQDPDRFEYSEGDADIDKPDQDNDSDDDSLDLSLEGNNSEEDVEDSSDEEDATTTT